VTSHMDKRFRLRRRGAVKRRSDCGVALVEHALVLVLFLTVVFGIIDFGRGLYTYHFVSNAAREATRWASVRGNACKAADCPASPSDVQTYVSNVSGMGLDPAKLTATTTYITPPNGIPGCNGVPNPGCVVEVEVDYTYNFIFPFLPTGPLLMKSTSQMVISQ
jgi:Flp pilus assembly protein TadG